jgi:hypothetical protein
VNWGNSRPTYRYCRWPLLGCTRNVLVPRGVARCLVCNTALSTCALASSLWVERLVISHSPGALLRNRTPPKSKPTRVEALTLRACVQGLPVSSAYCNTRMLYFGFSGEALVGKLGPMISLGLVHASTVGIVAVRPRSKFAWTSASLHTALS